MFDSSRANSEREHASTYATLTTNSRILVNMAAEHGEVHGRKVVGELGRAVGRGIDVLTVNDPVGEGG